MGKDRAGVPEGAGETHKGVETCGWGAEAANDPRGEVVGGVGCSEFDRQIINSWSLEPEC